MLSLATKCILCLLSGKACDHSSVDVMLEFVELLLMDDVHLQVLGPLVSIELLAFESSCLRDSLFVECCGTCDSLVVLLGT